MDEILQATNEIVERFGKDILCNTNAFYGALTDLVPKKRAEAELVRQVCEAGVMKQLASLPSGKGISEKQCQDLVKEVCRIAALGQDDGEKLTKGLLNVQGINVKKEIKRVKDPQKDPQKDSQKNPVKHDINKIAAAAAGLCLLIVLLGGGYFFMKQMKTDGSPEVWKSDTERMEEPTEPVEESAEMAEQITYPVSIDVTETEAAEQIEFETETEAAEQIEFETEISISQVEDCVEEIRGKYNQIVANISAGVYREENRYDGLKTYWDSNGFMVCAVAEKGFHGSAYSRFIYYDEGSLFFAYYESSDSHRLYFKDGRLIRWRYCLNTLAPDEAVNYDLGNSEEYRSWEETVRSDADEMLMLQ